MIKIKKVKDKINNYQKRNNPLIFGSPLLFYLHKKDQDKNEKKS